MDKVVLLDSNKESGNLLAVAPAVPALSAANACRRVGNTSAELYFLRSFHSEKDQLDLFSSQLLYHFISHICSSALVTSSDLIIKFFLYMFYC